MAARGMARYPLLALGCAAAGYSCQGVLETSAKRLAQAVVDLRGQEAPASSQQPTLQHLVSFSRYSGYRSGHSDSSAST